MIKSTRQKRLGLFLDPSKVAKPKTSEETPFRVSVPTFMVSELKRAFEKLIFFVLIDQWCMIFGGLVKSYPGAGQKK
jgi:flagellar biosynthesis protein FliP